GQPPSTEATESVGMVFPACDFKPPVLPLLESRVSRLSYALGPAGEEGLLSDSDDLRKVIEMPVPRVQQEIVLKNQCRQPDVVGGNRGSLFPELQKHDGTVMRRLVIGEEDFHIVLQEEASQRSFILRLRLA